jgi:hypothetical protein
MQGDHWENPAERYARLRQMERYARDTLSPLERLETERHTWVGFMIMPLFAQANAGVIIQAADIAMPVATAKDRRNRKQRFTRALSVAYTPGVVIHPTGSMVYEAHWVRLFFYANRFPKLMTSSSSNPTA